MSAVPYTLMDGDTAGTPHIVRIAGIFIFLLAVAAVVTAVVVSDSDDSSASITDDWTFDVNSKVLYYKGGTVMPDYTSTDNPIVALNASSASWVEFDTDVKNIGDFAFYGSSLNSVTIPDSVKSIGKASFGLCYRLKTVDLPSGLTEIRDNAFYSCIEVKSMNIPSSVTELGANAFISCTALKTVALPTYDSEYPDRTLVIKAETFSGCTSLESIYIPQHVTVISEYAFKNCSSMTAVTFQEEAIESGGKVIGYTSKIVSIGSYAFMGCSKLSTILIPDCLQTIGTDIFRDTPSLGTIETRGTNQHFRVSDGVLFDLGLSILYHYPSAKAVDIYTIPSSVITIVNTAFNGAIHLKSIAMSQSDIFSSEDGVLFDKDHKTLIRYPAGKTNSSYTIQDTVVTVNENAFYGATNLKDLVLPDSPITFKENSLSIGSFGNVAELHIDAPDGYKVSESACGPYTILNYGDEKTDNTMTYVIIAIVIAVIIVAAIVSVIIVKKRE